MKKILMFMVLVSGLYATDLTPTDENILGTAGDYTFVCADDTDRVWAVSKEEVNYKVIWFNPKSNKEEWLKCDDYDVYSGVYTPSK
jgi:hypothetical protein